MHTARGPAGAPSSSVAFPARDRIPREYDLVVIGGGINGTGIARDASGRGLSVLLCEKDDLASHTSSASTKLIHGGLRYLEYFEFRLVRKSLIERELLLKAAPHLMGALRFVIPRDQAMRPTWMIRAGLFLYDHLARRTFLPASGTLNLRSHPAGAALKSEFTRGFAYSDGWVDDARLVVLNAVDAADRGAEIATRTRCLGATREENSWRISLRDTVTGQERTVRARALVNAAGPWVAEFLARDMKVASRHKIRLVKGSHIIVKRLFEHAYAYLFQNPDGRVVFAIPYEKDFTLIGTTDVEFHDDPQHVSINRDEKRYLCDVVNRYFKAGIEPQDVVRSYSGVRPLLEDDAADASAVTRDYWLELNCDGAPIVSVFGGKITTFRRLAEEAMDLLLPAIGVPVGMRRHWTAHTPLPGGDLPDGDFAAYVAALMRSHAWLPPAVAERYAHAYGSYVTRVLDTAQSLSDLGDEIAPGLYRRELEYLARHEWAKDSEDVLWRRTKLGLHFNPSECAAVVHWMRERVGEKGISVAPE